MWKKFIHHSQFEENSLYFHCKHPFSHMRMDPTLVRSTFKYGVYPHMRKKLYATNIYNLLSLSLGCWLLLLLLLFALIKGSASNSTVNLIMPSRGSKLSTPAFIHYLIIQFKRIVNEFKESEKIRKSIIFRSKTLKNLHKPSRTRWNSLLNHKNIHIDIYIYIHTYIFQK